jgi:hypothetical protein
MELPQDLSEVNPSSVIPIYMRSFRVNDLIFSFIFSYSVKHCKCIRKFPCARIPDGGQNCSIIVRMCARCHKEWLVFINEAGCVFCAVPTESIYFRLSVIPGRTMAQAVSYRPVTRIGLGSFPGVCVCGICGLQSWTGRGLIWTTYVLPSQYHSTNTPYSSSSAGSGWMKDIYFGNLSNFVIRKTLCFMSYFDVLSPLNVSGIV